MRPVGAAGRRHAVRRWLDGAIGSVLIALLRGYRFAISPLYGQVCRYHPSCSAYALQAVTEHGAARGSLLAVRRVLRCHPWAAGGYDPVPAARAHAHERPAARAEGGGDADASSTDANATRPYCRSL